MRGEAPPLRSCLLRELPRKKLELTEVFGRRKNKDCQESSVPCKERPGEGKGSSWLCVRPWRLWEVRTRRGAGTQEMCSLWWAPRAVPGCSGGDKCITSLAGNWLLSHYVLNYVHHICSGSLPPHTWAAPHHRGHRGETREVLHMGKFMSVDDLGWGGVLTVSSCMSPAVVGAGVLHGRLETVIFHLIWYLKGELKNKF